MKNIKYLIFILPLLVLLSSCDFVKYVETPTNKDINNTELTNIEAEKKNYCVEIENLSSDSVYNEKERLLYMNYLVEAKSEINESKTLDEIKEVYDKYSLLIINLKTIEDYNQELLDEQNKYIDLLKEVSSKDLYREKEQKLYEFYLDAGIKAIQDETHKDNIKTIYESYKDTILDIKTDEDYKLEEAKALVKYKEDNINIINNHIDLSLYREAEANSITEILNEYTALINEANSNKEIDDLVVDYKIKVYSFKTDEELYKEELTELINNSITVIKNYKNVSNYRDNEVIIINSMIDTFEKQVIVLLNKELVNQLVESYKEVLDSIKDDKTLYEEERIELVNDSYNEMLTLVDLNNMTEESQQEYLDYCNQVKKDMLSLENKELIKSRLLSEKQNIYLLGAQLGDKNSLMELQDLLVDDLYNYLDMDLYREEQQSEILTIINTQGKIVKKQETYDNTLSSINDTHLLLDEVLTNDEMWEKEDAEFFVTLHKLYGDDILTPPASMTEANDYYELAKIIDYYAFYQLDGSSFVRDKFRVSCNFEKDKTDQYLKNEVYWYCELLNASIGIDACYENNYIVFTLMPYDFASISNVSTTQRLNKYEWKCDFLSKTTQIRGNDFDNFNYLKFKKSCIVSNSQQLWYALENNYIPIPVKDSKAEMLFNVAKNILRNIIKNDMTDEEKIYRIYEWISNNIQYDHQSYKYNNSSNMDMYPAENYSKLNSLHLEGGLLDGLCVCSGYAKTYLTLLKIEGIDAVKVIARNNAMQGKNTINSRDYGGGGFGFHEFVYINIDGQWYYSDAERSCLENNNLIHSYIYLLLSPYSQNYGFTTFKSNIEYANTYRTSIHNSIQFNNEAIYQDMANIIKEFSEFNCGNSQISFIIPANQYSSFVDYITYYSNLNYATHNIFNDSFYIVELIILIE